MADVVLTNPLGGQVPIDTDNVLIIFFSPFLSPPNARSNVIYNGQIRSFFEKPEDVVAKVDPTRKLIKLTLPDVGGNRAKGPIWFARAAIEAVKGDARSGARIDMKGQQGETLVVETKAAVEAEIAKIDQTLGMAVS